MLLNIESRTNLFVNQISLNYTFNNRKRYNRKRIFAKKYFHPNNIDEKISSTEHLNILNEYKDEIKGLLLNKKNTESSDNSQSIKDTSTRDSDIVICVESNSLESIEKIDENYSDEMKNFKLQKYNNNENKVNIFNLFNLRNSLINKNITHYNKVSNLIDNAGNEIKRHNPLLIDNDNDKITYERMKKKMDSKNEKNDMIKQLINKFYHFNFNNSKFGKLFEKINNSLINKNNDGYQSHNGILNEKIDDNNKTKKDIATCTNILIEKINNKNYKSSLSLTNDRSYMNSLIHVSNKFFLSGDKKENNLIKALEKNKKILDDFKDEKRESAEKVDISMLKAILKNMKIRKKLKSYFGFLQKISEKKLYRFLDENYLKSSDSLMNENEIKNIFKYFDKPDSSNFLYLVYFLLGMNYINKSQLKLSESELLSLVQKFLKTNKKKNKTNIQKKEKNKRIKLKCIKKGNNNNIIRINLEEVFDKTENIKNSMNLIENYENLNEV